jgi:predicted metal-dependent HD superfamily phosphohydrolase
VFVRTSGRARWGLEGHQDRSLRYDTVPPVRFASIGFQTRRNDEPGGMRLLKNLKDVWDEQADLLRRPELKVHGDFVLGLWDDPTRHFHNQAHLRYAINAFNLLEKETSPVERRIDQEGRARIIFSLCFHDVFYDSRIPDSVNIDRSALLSTKLGFDRDVARLVRSTAHASRPKGLDESYIMDSDIANLGGSYDKVWTGTLQIRAEYSHVPLEKFIAGRTAILTRFLDRPSIYYSETGYRLFENPARANLTQLIHDLNSGRLQL